MGYIKLFRAIEGWEWYDDPNTLALWIHILVGANRKDSVWHGDTVPRGSLVTTIARLAEETGLSDRQVRTCLDRLEKTGEIERSSTNKWTRITVRKYDTYQTPDTEPERAPEPKPTPIPAPAPEPPKKETPKKEPVKKAPDDGKERAEAANRLYSLYPTKCPVSGRSTGKSSKDKEKLARLLRDHTEQELADTIKRYVRESTEQQSFIKNFATFLNNLPDFKDQPEPEQAGTQERISREEAIKKAKNPTKAEIKEWWDKRMAPFYPKKQGETNADYRARVLPSYQSELKSWIENRVERVNQKYL